MARKKKDAVEVVITETLVIDSKQSYKVKTGFKGTFNKDVFDCKAGDVVMLSKDQVETYSRFLEI